MVLEDALKQARREKEQLQSAFETVNRDLEQSSQRLAESVKKLEIADEEFDRLQNLVDRIDVDMDSIAKRTDDVEKMGDLAGESVSSFDALILSLQQSVMLHQEAVARSEANTSRGFTLESKIRDCFRVFSDYVANTQQQLARLEDANAELKESSKRYSSGAEAFKQGSDQLM